MRLLQFLNLEVKRAGFVLFEVFEEEPGGSAGGGKTAECFVVLMLRSFSRLRFSEF